jgi:sortase B
MPATGKANTPTMDFEHIRKEAPDVVAWIRIDGTMIDYPVMYADDNEFYLEHLPNGKKSDQGSLFIDYRNAPDFLDPNTLVYGHRMKSGTMFGTLRYYNNQSYYDKHPTVSIFTPEGNYEAILFAGYTFDQTVEMPPTRFKNAEEFDKYIQDARRRSIFQSDVEVSATDRLVTLATCDYNFEDGRLVIVGKLIEK